MNEQIVRDFLGALEAKDIGAAAALLAGDVEYTNVSLPTIRGRRGVERAMRLALERMGGGFRVHYTNVATSGNVVLTERTDELRFGPVAQRFWVYGRFEVEDGLITVWRDSFDWRDLTVGLVRGLVGAVVPGLNRRWPG
jgi:limonene-1,2-epoxide hydrolase